MDESKNTLQEFNSHSDFTVEWINDWKIKNAHLKLDTDKYKLLPRKFFPLKNFIEQTQMLDYRKWFKNIQEHEYEPRKGLDFKPTQKKNVSELFESFGTIKCESGKHHDMEDDSSDSSDTSNDD